MYLVPDTLVLHNKYLINNCKIRQIRDLDPVTKANGACFVTSRISQKFSDYYKLKGLLLRNIGKRPKAKASTCGYMERSVHLRESIG